MGRMNIESIAGRYGIRFVPGILAHHAFTGLWRLMGKKLRGGVVSNQARFWGRGFDGWTEERRGKRRGNKKSRRERGIELEISTPYKIQIRIATKRCRPVKPEQSAGFTSPSVGLGVRTMRVANNSTHSTDASTEDAADRSKRASQRSRGTTKGSSRCSNSRSTSGGRDRVEGALRQRVQTEGRLGRSRTGVAHGGLAVLNRLAVLRRSFISVCRS
ncbi:hypothetical protein PoB_006818600 [Plakobranchus ocellatus]|uniref:Uncharacterized protein n=1 Tax=Plakobranchus ocellatus TaxID=259542 RepID=A0AAV4DC17_9GAST|nr:hypothetical protein PoB_006818600 [Plakobranchus ocellatus]